MITTLCVVIMKNMCSQYSRFIFGTFLILVLALSPACDGRNSHPCRYYIGFVNKLGRDANAVCAYYGETQVAAAGILVNGGNKTEGPVTIRIPSEARVQWDINGVRHSAAATLKGVVPAGFDGTIYFILKENDAIDSKAVRLNDIDGNANAIR